MYSESSKKKGQREITYQVGWKKGKIALNEGGAAEILVKSHALEESTSVKGQAFLRFLWQAVPTLPNGLLLPLLYGLPLVCFMLTLVLVYSLRF
ncbi:hypothetical protein GK047_21925 [Paenibacillus sp. SYP-B3998]|uniref:Uncharacterized protein n=1 Tax=Paenibacillus sp. SYP-B3998 TaxID=2678564 RepID=A0A6G4A2Z3_9BACL|nr:hypothetical protein [Paenibacillus sp. SYP-B3998]NEW08658.1 hypothetical protein [Paenibacillus sp. SYP-B3998]